MNEKPGTNRKLWISMLAIGTVIALSSSVQAKEFEWGDWTGNWDNTVVYGVSIRGGDADPALIGGGNGGTGPVILTDDGNLNFEGGDIFSNIIKGTSELGIDNGQFGFFGRIKYWYDFELEGGKMPHGHSPNDYVPNTKLDDSDFANYAKFSGLELLDLFVYGNFDLGDMPLDLRVGRQMVNWGESTFIQGVNVLNPIDVSALRRPGAELKEAFLPVAMVYGNLGLGNNWSLEGFYQLEWEPTVIDGCGTYFSTVDFASTGCNELIVGNVAPDSISQHILNARKDPNIGEARNGGQYGLAVRKYAEGIDTEFGFYYEKLHNRTPVLFVRYNNQAAIDGSVLAPAGPVPVYYGVEYPEDIDIFGASFATNVGAVALSGEISAKMDMPVGINGPAALNAALGSLNPAVCGSGVPNLLVGPFGSRACGALYSYATTGDGKAEVWDRFDVYQAQTTALYFWEQGLGSDRVTLIGEVAYIHVNDLPSVSTMASVDSDNYMPYGRNPIFGQPLAVPGGVSNDGLITTNSWGYRIRAAASYPNVFAGISLTPTLAWSHDVSGTSPTPTFSEGNKAFSMGLNANYLTKYRAGMSYTWFMGGDANAVADRDFFALTFSLDF